MSSSASPQPLTRSSLLHTYITLQRGLRLGDYRAHIRITETPTGRGQLGDLSQAVGLVVMVSIGGDLPSPCMVKLILRCKNGSLISVARGMESQPMPTIPTSLEESLIQYRCLMRRRYPVSDHCVTPACPCFDTNLRPLAVRSL
jgi:hypothetical protein